MRRAVSPFSSNDGYDWTPELAATIDFRVDQEHYIDWAELIRFDRSLLRRPVVNAEFGYELGVDDLPTHTNINQVDWRELLRRAYTI